MHHERSQVKAKTGITPSAAVDDPVEKSSAGDLTLGVCVNLGSCEELRAGTGAAVPVDGFDVGLALCDGVDSVVVHARPAMGNLGVEHEDPIGRVL